MRNLEEINAKEYGIIYKATNLVNGKPYIGQTTKSLQIRKAAHIRDHTNKNYSHLAFYRALNKYGEENFKWEVIDYAASDEELNTKEIYWIKNYDALGKRGYNMTAGGQGVKNYKVTEDGIQRRKDVFNRMWASGHAEKVQKGENAHMAKHSNKEILQIVDFLKQGKSYTEISALLNVRTSIVGTIRNGRGWRHIVSDKDVEEMKKGSKRKINDLTKEEVLEMKDLLLNSNISSLEIYEMYRLNKGQIQYMFFDSKWKELFTDEEIGYVRKRKNVRRFKIIEIINIKEMLEENLYTTEEIAYIFDTTNKQIQKIISGESWSNVLIDLPMEDIEIYDWKPIEIKPRKPNRKNQN